MEPGSYGKDKSLGRLWFSQSTTKRSCSRRFHAGLKLVRPDGDVEPGVVA